MAHQRNRFPRGRSEKVIDAIRWAGNVHTFAAQGAGSVAQTMVTDGTQETIMRIRGELYASIDAASTPGKAVDIALGALVVQAGSGSTVIQKPITDPDAPWLFYERFTLGYEEMVTDVIDVPGLTSFRKTIDNKAMRILREGREVQLVLEAASLISTAPVNVVFSFRMLLGVK